MRKLDMNAVYLWAIAAMLLAFGLSGSVCAEEVDFWIGDSTGTPVTQANTAINGEVTLSVWMTNNYQTKALELLFGYDTTESKGASATKLDNKIGLVSVAYGAVASAMTSKHPYNWYGGDYSSSSTERRPGGYRLALDLPVAPPTALGAYGTATKVFDITLKNLGVASGEEYYVGLWNAGSTSTSGGSFCTKARTTSMFRDVDSGDSYNPVYGAGTGWAVKITNTNAGTPVSINDAKSAQNGTAVVLSNAIVTAAFNDTNGRVGFAVEESDRYSGIRIVSSKSVSAGDKVTIHGTIATISGERVIDATSGSVDIISSGNTAPKPLGTSNKGTGGGTYCAQEAVVDTAPSQMSCGINNVGLLLKIWGTVKTVNDTHDYNGYFYIDDGTGLQDGSGNIGIKCRPAPGVSMPGSGSFVSVTGVMGVQQIGGVNARYFWTTSWQ